MWAILLAAAVVAVGAMAWWRPGLLAEAPPRLAWLPAAAGAIALALSDAAPTGWVPLDVALRAALGALVPLAAARAGRLSLLWLAVVATLAGVVAQGWPASLAAVGLGLLLGAAASDERSDLLRAVAAAAAVTALGHLDESIRTHLPSIAMLVAVLPVLLVGLARAPRRASRWAWAAIGVGVLVAAAGAAGGSYAAFQARTEVDRAVDAAVRGLDLLDGDDREAAAAELEAAAAAFARAEADLGAWWARPARAVPAVAQQSRAVATMASSGRDLAETAAAAIGAADIDAARPVDGAIDLAALDALRPPLVDSLASLSRADERLSDVESPLLLPPVDDRLDDLAARVSDARASAATAAAAVEVAPGLLGADGPRRYFLALQTPSELRGVGGFMGSWGELVFDQGRFDLVRTGRLRELSDAGTPPAERQVEGPPAFVERYGEVSARTFGLVGFSPHFPTVGSILAQLYPQAGGGEVDGVIALDPAAFAAFLELTGPIEVPGYPQRLTPEDAAQELLFDQYLTFPGQQDEDREQFLADASEVLFDALTSGDLPGPGGIAGELGPAVDGRHLQLFSMHDDEQRFFQRIGAAGPIERGAGDAIGLVGQNYNGNKIDWFLRRSLTYDLTWDPASGEVDGTVEISITNEAPASGLPRSIIGWGGDVSLGQTPVADGENFMQVSLFSGLEVGEVSVEGEPVEVVRGSQQGLAETYWYLRVPSGATRVVRAEVRGRAEPSSEYRVRLVRQATVVPDDVEVRVHLAPGWVPDRVVGGERVDDGARGTWSSAQPHELRVQVEPAADRSLLDRLRGR